MLLLGMTGYLNEMSEMQCRQKTVTWGTRGTSLCCPQLLQQSCLRVSTQFARYSIVPLIAVHFTGGRVLVSRSQLQRKKVWRTQLFWDEQTSTCWSVYCENTKSDSACQQRDSKASFLGENIRLRCWICFRCGGRWLPCQSRAQTLVHEQGQNV